MGNSLPMLFLFLAGQPESLHMEKLDGPKKSRIRLTFQPEWGSIRVLFCPTSEGASSRQPLLMVDGGVLW
jgi:hypothetical protein